MGDMMGKMERSIKSMRSHQKSPCPPPWYLNKSSNLRNFEAWDVDGRVVDMESQFKELKDMVNTTLIERKGHDNALELAKTRGKPSWCA